MIRLNVSLALADASALERDILAGLSNAQPALNSIAGKATPVLQDAVRKTLRASTTYLSLLTGKLRKDFGIEDPENEVEAVVNAAAESASAWALPASPGFIGGLAAGALRSDFSDALLGGGRYASEGRPFRKPKTISVVPWLEWLLFAGDTVVVENFWVKYGEFPGSRSGGALMRPSGKKTKKSFAVDPVFSGTVGDNWLTRSARLVEQELLSILLSEIKGTP